MGFGECRLLGRLDEKGENCFEDIVGRFQNQMMKTKKVKMKGLVVVIEEVGAAMEVLPFSWISLLKEVF